MSDRDLPPLDPKVASLLASEKIIVAQGNDIKARAFARAAAGALLSATSVPAVREPFWSSPGRLSWTTAGALAVAAAGVLAFNAWRGGRGSLPVEPVPASSAASEAIAPPRVEPLVQSERAQAEGMTSDAPADTKSAPVDPAQIAGELQLLERARVAILRGNYDDALAPIAEHERRFPDGHLAEEREALRIRSLSALGHMDEARRAAAAFRVRFPRSVLLSQMNELSRKAPKR